MYLLSSAGSVNRAVPDVMRQPTAYGVRLSGALRPTGSFDACPVFGGGSALKQMHRQHAGARTTRNARLCRARSAQIPEKIPDFLWKSRCSGAHADRPAVTRKKKRLQGGCSDQDALRFRVSPDQPASRSSYMGQRGAHPHRDQQITTFWSEISAKFRAPCSNPCVLDAEREEIDAKGGAGMRANQAILLFA